MTALKLTERSSFLIIPVKRCQCLLLAKGNDFNISAWRISSLNEYSVQIRLGSNLGGFFHFGKRKVPMAERVDPLDSDEKIVEIELERLRVFANHPFHVEMDSQMKELQESIEKYGIITPVIARPRKEGYYEIISGHRRVYAAKKLGYRKVPTIRLCQLICVSPFSTSFLSFAL